MHTQGFRIVGIGLMAAVVAALAPAAAQAAPLLAAFDEYVPGKGFEVGLVNTATGARVAVPAAVNTTDDELHPALSPDGRHLVFSRMHLQPKLNGDVVVPATRTVHALDRTTGVVTAITTTSTLAGPTLTGPSSALQLNLAKRVVITAGCCSQGADVLAFKDFSGPGGFNSPKGLPIATNGTFDATHAAVTNVVGGGKLMLLSAIGTNPTTGALDRGFVVLSRARAVSGELEVASKEFGSPGAPAHHPVARPGDNYIALEASDGTNTDIQTIQHPEETALTVAPAPITTTDPERTPAWSPDGVQLGFIRVKGTSTVRKLIVFDTTPGIQAPLNTPVSLSAEAPTPQLRAFQNSWGGLSLSAVPAAQGGTTISCGTACLGGLTNLGPITLTPTVAGTTAAKVGIFVARVTGTRKLFGRSVPRVRVVGRVPLGTAIQGRNRFAWNRKVNGRRLAAGTYLLTFRSLDRKGRVLDTSDSLRFRVTSAGAIVGVRRQT